METSVESLWLLACLAAIAYFVVLYAIPREMTQDIFYCGILLAAIGVVGFFECINAEKISVHAAVITTGMFFSALVCIFCARMLERAKSGDKDGKE